MGNGGRLLKTQQTRHQISMIDQDKDYLIKVTINIFEDKELLGQEINHNQGEAMTHQDQGVVMTHQNQGGMMNHQDQEKGEAIITKTRVIVIMKHETNPLTIGLKRESDLNHHKD